MTDKDYADPSYKSNDHSKAVLAKLETALKPYGLRVARERPRISGNPTIAAQSDQAEYAVVQAWRLVDDGMGNYTTFIAQVIIDDESDEPRLQWMATGEPVTLKEFEADLKGIQKTYHTEEFSDHTVNRVLFLLASWMNPSDELNKSKSFPTPEEVDAFYASPLPYKLKLDAIRQGIKFEELAMYDELPIQQVRALLGF
jgi:hypothetical protein